MEEPDTTSKHESSFHLDPWLGPIQALRPEAVPWSKMDRLDKGKITAHKDSVILERGGRGDGPPSAAGTKNQIDGLLAGVSRARDVFPSPRQGEVMLEAVVHQKGAALG